MQSTHEKKKKNRGIGGGGGGGGGDIHPEERKYDMIQGVYNICDSRK